MPHRWYTMFRDAARGVRFAIGGERNFRVHVPAAVAVVAAGAYFRVTAAEWLALTLCITLVFVAEMLNTSIEHLAKVITRQHSEPIGAALDIAAGAVLIAALGSVACGLLIFVPYMRAMWTT